jgi:23S rRNA (uridine2552-2'-O)-methyltransferase
MSQKTRPSSARWLNEHRNDHYVQEARRLGYRCRAVFKLQELNTQDKLLKPGMTVVDLGAAPGGWSEFARPLLGTKGRLIATDILPMDAIADVDFIHGDFREDSVLKAVEDLVGSAAIDLVLSDMAPNISGIDAADQAASLYLCELALEFAVKHLKPNGGFVVKVFQGDGFDAYLKAVRAAFGSASIRKPKASRPRSSEVYVVAKNFRRV